MMITAGQDTVCCSNESKKFFENSTVEDKSIMDFSDANHEIVKDREYVSQVLNEAIAWQNMHLY